MAPPRRPETVIGLDTGKASHWACVATRDGEVLLSAPVANRESELDALFVEFPGALELSRAKAAGCRRRTCRAWRPMRPRSFSAATPRPTSATRRSSRRPRSASRTRCCRCPSRPRDRDGEGHRRANGLLNCENTRSKNRLHSILPESCPKFEALVDLSDAAELEAATAAISALLERDETYRCLLTIPGVRPKTASKLAISINIDDFTSHDRLASYCGLAPRNRQSGTSTSSVSASRQENKRLKSLLIFSCNCLARTEGRWGEYYARCRARGMPHGKTLKAVARKRLR